MKIRGNTVGTPMAIPDWDQDNPLRADYIKNKPEDRLLPSVTEEDNDKILLVKDGKWVSDNVPNLGGKDGEDGKDGKDGADGKDGEDGVGIASVEQTVVSTADGGTNIVTVTLTNGASYDFAFMNGRTGPQGPQGIQGIPGEDGKGFSISKIYASIIDMMNGYATDGVEVGGFVLINTGNVEDADNAKLFVKTETAYSYLSDLSGSQGIQGPEGRQGIQGPVGNTGVGIHYIYQSQTTSADGGKNVVTIMLTNGTEYSCTFYNGSKGSDGKDGATGAAGVGISKVEQTTTSTADSGNNVVTVTLTNGNTSTFTVKNGSKGSDGKDGTNGKDGKTPAKGTDYWTEADKAEIVQAVINTLGGEPVFGYVDNDNNIILSGSLSSGTYTVKYEMDNGSTLNIGELKFSYKVTNNLTYCTNSNKSTSVSNGGSYSATITANSGYTLKTVTVTMGGNAVSVSGGTINIAKVTGDIVITAVAEQAQARTNFFVLSEAFLGRLSSSGADRTDSQTTYVTNYVSVQNGDTVEISGCDICFPDASGNNYYMTGYNSSKTNVFTDRAYTTNSNWRVDELTDSKAQLTVLNSNIAYFRFTCGNSKYGKEEMVDTSAIVINIKRNGQWL